LNQLHVHTVDKQIIFKHFLEIRKTKQESPANAKVSARQQCVLKATGEEIYGKSTKGTQC